jgi:hypothetical protein
MTSFISNPPLREYLDTLGSVVYQYDGYEWFETILTAMIYNNASFVYDCYLCIPNGNKKAMDAILKSGARFVKECNSEILIKIFNDEIISDDMCLNISQGRFNNPNIHKDVKIIVEDNDFKMSKQMKETIHSSSPFMELDIQDVPFVGGQVMVTNSWKSAVIGCGMGMNVQFISGPSYPAWAGNVFDRSGVKIRKVEDRKDFKNCPCSSHSKCHDKSSPVKPCMNSKILLRYGA